MEKVYFQVVGYDKSTYNNQSIRKKKIYCKNFDECIKAYQHLNIMEKKHPNIFFVIGMEIEKEKQLNLFAD